MKGGKNPKPQRLKTKWSLKNAHTKKTQTHLYTSLPFPGPPRIVITKYSRAVESECAMLACCWKTTPKNVISDLTFLANHPNNYRSTPPTVPPLLLLTTLDKLSSWQQTMLQFSEDFLSIKRPFAAQQQPSLIWHVPALKIFPCVTLSILSREQNVK